MAGPENTLSTDASTSFTSSTAAQNGGLLYIAGTTGDQKWTITGTTINGGYATNSMGGLARIQGTNSEVIIKN